MDSSFRYTGHYFHARSGLYLAPYRAYEPTLGRWLNRDPIGESGGLNLYGYVGDNPVNRVDPLGLQSKRIELPIPRFPIPGLSGEGYQSPSQVIGKIIQGCYDAIDRMFNESCDDDSCSKGDKEHTKNKRNSTKGKHEKGRSRNKRDKKGGEKGDDRRPY